jgi:midasin
MINGHWLLLDEFNLAEPGVLERLNPLLDGENKLVITEKNCEVVNAHPDFRVFCTSNPVTYSGRKHMSAAMSNRLEKIKVREMQPKDILEIIEKKGLSPDELDKLQHKRDTLSSQEIKALEKKGNQLPKNLLLQMSEVHFEVTKACREGDIGMEGGPYPYTIRDISKWMDRIEHFMEKEPNEDALKIVCREGMNVYTDRFRDQTDKEAVWHLFANRFKQENMPPKPSEKLEDKKIINTGNKAKIGKVELDVDPNGGMFVPKKKLSDVPSTVDMLEKMAKCVAVDEPVLLVGETASGKTAKTKYLANIANKNLRRYNLSMQTDPTEFIGGYKPTGKPGEYKWTDGIIVDAMKKGDWVLLDEYNLADPAIAERLNSLLEGDRELVLSEKGNEKIKAHPDFRVFGTMNPATYEGRNEVSLAARNRFTEVWDPGIEDSGELKDILVDFLGDDISNKEKVADKMVDFQDAVAQKVDNMELAAEQDDIPLYTIRDLDKWSGFINRYAEEDGVQKAFLKGADFLYSTDLKLITT